jgi:hypothetical protein
LQGKLGRLNADYELAKRDSETYKEISEALKEDNKNYRDQEDKLQREIKRQTYELRR